MINVEPTDLGQEARGLRLDTLVRLRWLAVIGQSAAVAGVHFGLGFKLPFGACLGLIALSALLNLGLRIGYPASHRLSDDAATGMLAFDILQLASLLYLTGGLQNPFSLLFLAPVLISAAALPPERTLALGLLAVGAATLLVLAHRPLPWHPGQPLELPFLYVSGVWTAILLGAAFTGVYTWRVAEEARQLGAALVATELVLAREKHISQLDGLAAAAAHELGTPLATIALVVKELSRRLPGDDPETADDMRLLREQVERCRGILGKLTSLGQEEDGAAFLETMTLTHLIEEVVAPLRDLGAPIRMDAEGEGPEPVCRRNPGLVHGLDNLVDNAVGFAEAMVEIELAWSPQEVSVEVRDDGPGFAPEVLLRLGEPYVTTRGHDKRGPEEEASGHGLGLFIAKTLIERSGARLVVTNAAPPDRGAIVRVVWPREAFDRREPEAREKESLSR
ncbi:MAG TPA: ActS/PrrB/RegB family redox-sensitive histidine kinase [Salinarimonas sp.]|nr:ActS/PrrB/RegB family redox-sensitive histidine kinase [Salinarimonas sp.]